MILIVEDDPAVRNSIKFSLEAEGYQVRERRRNPYCGKAPSWEHIGGSNPGRRREYSVIASARTPPSPRGHQWFQVLSHRPTDNRTRLLERFREAPVRSMNIIVAGPEEDQCPRIDSKCCFVLAPSLLSARVHANNRWGA